MHLGVFVLGTGNHSAGWRYPGAATSNNDLSVIQEIARIAERGRFDLLFVADGLVMDPGDHPSFLCRFEPTTLLAVLSATTRHVGLGATVSTSFGEPYHPHLCLAGPSQPGPRRLERGHELRAQSCAEFQPRAAHGPCATLRGRE
jgi:hypothetical protein